MSQDTAENGKSYRETSVREAYALGQSIASRLAAEGMIDPLYQITRSGKRVVFLARDCAIFGEFFNQPIAWGLNRQCNFAAHDEFLRRAADQIHPEDIVVDTGFAGSIPRGFNHDPKRVVLMSGNSTCYGRKLADHTDHSAIIEFEHSFKVYENDEIDGACFAVLDKDRRVKSSAFRLGFLAVLQHIGVSVEIENKIAESREKIEEDSAPYHCANCGEPLNDDETYSQSGDYYSSDVYCESCHSNLFSYCECGDHDVPNDDIVMVYKPSKWAKSGYTEAYCCSDCAQHEYKQCDHCGDYYPNDSMVETSDTDDHFCPNCWEDHTAICDACDETINASNVEHIGDKSLCADCAEHYTETETGEAVCWPFEYENQPISIATNTTHDGYEYTIVEYGNPFSGQCNWYDRVTYRSEALIEHIENQTANIANQ